MVKRATITVDLDVETLATLAVTQGVGEALVAAIQTLLEKQRLATATKERILGTPIAEVHLLGYYELQTWLKEKLGASKPSPLARLIERLGLPLPELARMSLEELKQLYRKTHNSWPTSQHTTLYEALRKAFPALQEEYVHEAAR